MIDIALADIVSVSNYRTEYPADHIAGLADSMREYGFKPEFAITVYPLGDGKYAINTGHCRTLAARAASLVAIPAIVIDGPDLLAQLGENENRRDPSDIDRANGYSRAISAGSTIEQVCKATGKTRDYIDRRLALLKLIPLAQELVHKHQLPIMYAVELATLESNFQQIALTYYNKMVAPNLEAFKAIVNDLYTKQSQCSMFDLALFNGKPIEQVMSELKIERIKSRAELESELLAAKREIEWIKNSAQTEIVKLRNELRKRVAA